MENNNQAPKPSELEEAFQPPTKEDLEKSKQTRQEMEILRKKLQEEIDQQLPDFLK